LHHINNKINSHIYILYDYNQPSSQRHSYIERIGGNEDYFERNLINFFNKAQHAIQINI